MRRVCRFSKTKFTQGTANLHGVLGIPIGFIATLQDLRGTTGFDLQSFRRTPGRILLHYLTEPPKINFVAVTSFLDGGILGIDYQPQPTACREVFSIANIDGRREITRPNEGSVPVYDASALIAHSRKFLAQHPIKPGALVFEAHQEWHNETAGTIYAMLAIAQPEAPDQNYLLMEDAGQLQRGEEIQDVQESLALSVMACEDIENKWGDERTRYKAVYLIGVIATVPAKSWAQVQLIYCLPPRQSRLAGEK